MQSEILFNKRRLHLLYTIIKNKLKVFLILFSVLTGFLYASENATIIFKSGEKLECAVDEYDLGKWIVIIEDTGYKRIIAWDTVSEVVFKKAGAPTDSTTTEAVKDSTVITHDPIPVPQVTEESKPDEEAAKPMNLAQRLALKEQERKEKEAAEAKKKADLEAEMKLKKEQQKAEDKKESKSIFNVFKKKETAQEKDISAENEKNNPAVLTEEEKQRKEQVELKAQKKIEEETAKKKEEEKSESKSIFNVFKKQEAEKAAVAPAAVAETGSSKTEAEKTKEEKFKEEIREENKYEKPEVEYDKDSGKMGVSYYKTLESDATRRAWIEEGGILQGKGFTANYTYASMDMDIGDGDSSFDMHGFGMTYSGTMKWIKPPSYAERRNLWTAFSLGAMGSFNMTFGSMPMQVYDGYNPNPPYNIYWRETEANISVFTYEVSLPVGYTFGLGRYFSSDTWRGVMLGLYWKPNFVMSMMNMEVDGEYMDPLTDTQFNLSGIQWTIDWGSFGSLADRIANEAHFSVSGYIIPETDVTPFMLSIGLGLVWY